jgi:hypothetical protein
VSLGGDRRGEQQCADQLQASLRFQFASSN